MQVRRLLSIIRLWWQDLREGGKPLPSWDNAAPEDSKSGS
jgi:hypothetical protein